MSAGQPVVITDQHEEVLEQFVPQYAAAAKKDQFDIRKKAMEQLLPILQIDGQALPPLLVADYQEKVKTWFQNRLRSGKAKQPKLPFTRGSTYLEVYAHDHPKDVEKRWQELGGEIKHWKQAAQQLTEDLDEEELNALKERTKQLKMVAGPPELQKKKATKKAVKYIKAFAEYMYREMNVRMFMLSAFQDVRDRVICQAHDFNDVLGEHGESFVGEHPDWDGEHGVMSTWGEWAHEIYTRQVGNPEEKGAAVKAQAGAGQAKPLFSLETDAEGLPVLPAKEDLKDLTTDQCKALIRAFLTMHYRQASDNTSANIPWKHLAEDTDEFLADGMLPDNVRLLDPSHLRKEHVDILLAFWIELNDTTAEGFRFSHFVTKDQFFPAIYPPPKPAKAGGSSRDTARKTKPAPGQSQPSKNVGPARKKANDKRPAPKPTRPTPKAKGKRRADEEAEAESSNDESSSEESDLPPSPPTYDFRDDLYAPEQDPTDQAPEWCEDSGRRQNAFLLDLTEDYDYRDAAEAVDIEVCEVVSYTVVPRLDPLPVAPWADWRAESRWLPEDCVRDPEQITELLTWLQSDAISYSTRDRDSVMRLQQAIFILGMLFFNIQQLQFAFQDPDDDMPAHMPDYMQHLPLRFSHLETVLKPACRRITGLIQDMRNGESGKPVPANPSNELSGAGPEPAVVGSTEGLGLPKQTDTERPVLTQPTGGGSRGVLALSTEPDGLPPAVDQPEDHESSQATPRSPNSGGIPPNVPAGSSEPTEDDGETEAGAAEASHTKGSKGKKRPASTSGDESEEQPPVAVKGTKKAKAQHRKEPPSATSAAPGQSSRTAAVKRKNRQASTSEDESAGEFPVPAKSARKGKGKNPKLPAGATSTGQGGNRRLRADVTGETSTKGKSKTDQPAVDEEPRKSQRLQGKARINWSTRRR